MMGETLPEQMVAIGAMVGSTELLEIAEKREVTDMCTALEKLKQEGREKGIQEGIAREQQIRIHAMLEKGYLIAEISMIFDLSEQEILKIQEEMCLTI